MNAVDLFRIAVEAMRTRGLLPVFSEPALQEAESRRHAVPAATGDIRDLRRQLWFSIDNDDTRDLDQLSTAEALPGGAARLWVAVADVEASVQLRGAVDQHAATNTTSVYTDAGVFPMLPELLSTDLTSLREHAERLAVVVEMLVQPDGTVSQSQIYRGVVLNQAKLAYDSVAGWLDGQSAAPAAVAASGALQTQLRVHDRIAQALKQWRQQRGALTLSTLEARPVFRDGQVVDLRPEQKNRAKDLIADLMIATNSATSHYLGQRGFPTLRRVLHAPARWDRIVLLARTHGVTLPPTPDAVALDRFLTQRRRAAPRDFAELSLEVVKLLGSGAYAASMAGDAAQGHFGLAVNDYAHSTAPNRRFPDLVTQRLLKAALRGDAPPYSAEALTQIAQHCTRQEDNANKVERQVRKAAAALLLQGRIGEVFDAIVTGASAKGTFVRIQRPMVEGRVVSGPEGLDVGDTVRVRLIAVDPAHSFIDFQRA